MTTTGTWKCEVCGYIHEGAEPPPQCPVCGADRQVFVTMEIAVGTPATAPAVGAWRCGVCDYVHRGARAPGICPVCGAGGTLFQPTHGESAGIVSAGAGPVVIAGAGIAGITAAQRARLAAPDVAVTVIGRETEPPYYRLNLTRMLAGEVAESQLSLHPAAWYLAHRIELIRGEITGIDAGARTVTLGASGERTYGKLILANGSHPFVPPLPGATRRGVHTLRTIDDARRILSRARPGTRCVCVGGGLLGLEAAGALGRMGLEVSVVESFAWLLPRQLPEPAGRLLEGHMGSKGISVLVSAAVKDLAGDESVRAVVLADGRELQADMVIISTGVRPNSHLARRASLKVASGVVVDDRMFTSDPHILAAGDVAEHRGAVHGIWPVAYAQGAVAGTNAAGGAAEYLGVPRSNRLKVMDVDLFSVGVIESGDGSYDIHERQDAGRYARLVVRDGRLVGAVLYGDTTLAGPIAGAIESGRQLAEALELRAALEWLRGASGKPTNADMGSATTKGRERDMASLKGTKTERNLLKAFAGESQARMRYTYAAKVARKAGLVQIAGIFEETAANEQEHAKVFFKFLEGGPVEITATYPAGIIDDTAGNLLAAAEGEKEEWTELYPAFAATAKEEGFPLVAAAFEMIAKVEKEHEARYRKLLDRVKTDTLYSREKPTSWKCENCGYIHTGNTPPEKCPACQHHRNYFQERAQNY